MKANSANPPLKTKGPDNVYLLISSSICAKKSYLNILDECLRAKKIEYGENDKIFKYSMVCVVEFKDPIIFQVTEGSCGSGCEEAAIIIYLDAEAWKEIKDIWDYCDLIEKYIGIRGAYIPRVHFVLNSVKERISGKCIEGWTMEKYEDIIGDIVIKYHFDLIELSNEIEAAHYISEIAEAYSEMRERKKADQQKKILNVASKSIKGTKGTESKLFTTWMAGLACIPGISENKARAITKEYPTIRSLMEKYTAKETSAFRKKDKEELLCNVKFPGHSDEKANKIGKKLSKRVYTYFTSLNPDEILN